MAQVPYSPEPTPLQPTDIRGPQVNATPGAFGVNIAQSIDKLGATAGQAGNELFARAMEIQGLHNETTARETAIQATQKMAIDYEQFRNNTTGSPEELATFLKGLENTRQQFRQGLNPMAAKLYDAEAANLQGRMTLGAAAENATTLKRRTDESATAGIKVATEQWVDPESDTEATAKQKQIDAALETKRQVNKWTEDQFQAAKLTAYSDAWVKRIETIGLTKPDIGFAMLDQADEAGEITGGASARLQSFLRTQNRAIMGDRLAEKIFNEGGTLDEMRAKAKEQAPALAHGDDTEFTRHVLSGIEHNNYFVRQAEQQQKRTDAQLVYSTIDQTHPLSESEFLNSNPDAAAAYHRLKAQGMFPHGLGTLLTQKVSWDEDSLRLYSTLKAEAEVDPNAFLQRDIPSLAIPNSAKVGLINLQTQKAKNPTGNVALMTTFHDLRALFPNSVPDPTTDKQGALEYQGQLLDVMQQYMTEKKTNRIPLDDLKKIGQGLNATFSVPGWFGPKQEHLYELQPPSVVMDAMRAQGRDDDSIIRDYRRARSQELFSKLFSGSAKAKPEAKGPQPPQSQ